MTDFICGTTPNTGLLQPGPKMDYLTCFYAGAAVNWFGIKVNQFTAAHSWSSDPGLQQAVDVMCHYMGKLLVILFFFISNDSLCQDSQRLVCVGISLVDFDTCKYFPTLKLDPNSKTSSQGVSISLNDGGKLSFSNEFLDDKYKSFRYLGTAVELGTAVLKYEEYNDEKYLLVNLATGGIDTIIGLPVFSCDRKYFACINNPGSDENQTIDIFSLSHGAIQKLACKVLDQGTCCNRILTVHSNYILLANRYNQPCKIDF